MNTPTYPTVVVYSFQVYDRPSQDFVHAPFKAQREQILQRYAGRVLEGTGEEIPADLLDAQGRYRRVPTGWGELSD